MRWIHPLAPEAGESADVLGGKAHGLVVLRRLGLPVPAGFVIAAEACRAFLRDGRLPAGLAAALVAAVADLQAPTHRGLDGPERPFAVSVRSGASVSMPGMMDTVLDLDLTGPRRTERLERAVVAVFSSWDTPRARTYRDIHGIPPDLGTAVTVQAMVYGDRDEHSGAGVAFSRNPNTGAAVQFGEVLFGSSGAQVVSGRASTRPLADLADREPRAWADLRHAMARVEEHYRDACYLEFTVEAGELWLLQVRPAGFVGAAAVRVATELAGAGVIGRDQALLRVSAQDLHQVRIPRMVVDDATDVLARGLGACPGVTCGRIATTSDAAARMAATGPIILVRPETSPLDMRGIAAAAGVVTARGGPASHAAVVARAMGKPAVVGIGDLTVTETSVRVGGRTIAGGTRIAIDGTGGEVVLGAPRTTTAMAEPHLRQLLEWADEVSGENSERAEIDRLDAAQAALRDLASLPGASAG